MIVKCLDLYGNNCKKRLMLFSALTVLLFFALILAAGCLDQVFSDITGCQSATVYKTVILKSGVTSGTLESESSSTGCGEATLMVDYYYQNESRRKTDPTDPALHIELGTGSGGRYENGELTRVSRTDGYHWQMQQTAGAKNEGETAQYKIYTRVQINPDSSDDRRDVGVYMQIHYPTKGEAALR